MSKYLSERLAALTPYTPGEQPQDQQYIKLNTNESPYLPSPAVVAAEDLMQECSIILRRSGAAITLMLLTD